jgi:hypothetical protein
MKPDSISQAMLKLESLAEVDPVLACILMAHLWPIANDLLMHDVCDAIDLWISNQKSQALIDRLRLVVNSEQDSDVRHHHESSWLGAK